MDWARRVVATRTFKVLFVAIVAVVVLGAIFGDRSDTTTRPPPRVISTTTPTITVSPTDTKLPPIAHPPTPAEERAARRTAKQHTPVYCGHYADWLRAEGTVTAIELRNPSDNVNDWRPGDVGRWRDALDRRAAAANRIWDAAPAGYTMADVRSAC